MLCYSQEGLCASLTTLPSEALQTEALKLFKVMWEWSPVCGMLVPKLSLQSLAPPQHRRTAWLQSAPGVVIGRESPTGFPLWLPLRQEHNPAATQEVVALGLSEMPAKALL